MINDKRGYSATYCEPPVGYAQRLMNPGLPLPEDLEYFIRSFNSQWERELAEARRLHNESKVVRVEHTYLDAQGVERTEELTQGAVVVRDGVPVYYWDGEWKPCKE